MAFWIRLGTRYPEANHRIPNGEYKCPHCGGFGDECYEVSDWVHVRTGREGERSIRARWNKTTGLWEQVIGHDGSGEDIIDPVVAPFIEWRKLS